MFKKVDPKMNLPKMEEEILKFWEKDRIFEKSVEKESPQGDFIFYEGPPTANGQPGLHHVLARAFKDIIPRYKTMKGYRVERKAGWDTHGLPVELQVEKELGLKNKQDIENIIPGNPRESIIKFNERCKESVWKYKDLWEKMTRRMAYWVDMKNPYVTYENEYMESVWWVVAQIAKTKNAKGESLIYKGHKVVPYCYRCGTALSSHEVAQGYQKTKDTSVFVKFKLKSNGETQSGNNQTYFLVWTTTAWTLPGNVALAVGSNIKYVEIRCDKEKYILSKDLLSKLIPEDDYELISEFEGTDLVGKGYEPLYETNNTDKKAYYVVAGDFVTTQEGTGIVHIAPAFGEDDNNVGRENDLPTLVTVDLEGKISVPVPGSGIPVKKKNDKSNYAVDDLIIEDLSKRNLLFKTEKYEHDYPFCWRCDTPLVYYAKPSWFIRMSELSDKLVKNNEPTNWVPEHIKYGRFGEWLSGVKDWAISRERYWGTPLPIWECKKCGKTRIVESQEELQAGLGKFFVLRHGEAKNNVDRILSCLVDDGYSLTKKGVADIEKIAEKLKKEKFDLIISSDLDRTKQTAEIISRTLGVEIIFDERLRETNFGDSNGIKIDDVPGLKETWDIGENMQFANGDNRCSLKNRVESFYNDFFSKFKDKKVLIVSHGDLLTTLEAVLSGRDYSDAVRSIYSDHVYIQKGELRNLKHRLLDLHKPYIDEVRLNCSCGGEMERVPEVLDVWFDSGSMPLAQWHYPNDCSEDIKKKIETGKYFPADFISEAIDQTRGWFYTLHAIATLLNTSGKVPEGYAFRNVICLGHILDAKGKKMSKSRGNIVEPMAIMDQFGADMLRWMLYTINQPGLPKRFDIKGMNDIMNRVFRMLWNSYYFFVMYASIDKFYAMQNTQYATKKANLLDRWIISELQMLIKEVDGKLAGYDVYGAAKPIEKFVDNLSNWYIRRSRRRFWKSESDSDKKEAYETLHYVLVTLAKLMAPFTPFITEELYKNLTGEESVHLADFPVADEKLIDEKLNSEMGRVREIITEGLQIRAKEKIKVRQPLRAASIKHNVSNADLQNIIKEELNVKEVVIAENQEEEITLDTSITQDLKLEGMAREIIRHIQEMRKEAGYEVDNRIQIWYSLGSDVFEKFSGLIAKETLATDIEEGLPEQSDLSRDFQIEDIKVSIAIKKQEG